MKMGMTGEMNRNASGRYAAINGLSIYYEIHGTGRPLVLLHGALTTIEWTFGRMLPSLAGTRQVIAIEQQAHGHTADINRPLTYEGMAADTVELLRQIGIEEADVFGYSMGPPSPSISPSGTPTSCTNSSSPRRDTREKGPTPRCTRGKRT